MIENIFKTLASTTVTIIPSEFLTHQDECQIKIVGLYFVSINKFSLKDF